MAPLRSFPLRLTLGLSLALAGGSLVVTGCSKPKQSEPAKDAKAKPKAKAPAKPKPKNPWLDDVIKDAEVTITYQGGEPIACEWDASKKRHLCPDQEQWAYVGPEVRRVGPKDEYCVWQHPVEDGFVTTKLAGLAKRPLELRHAFVGRSHTVQEAAPVDVVVRVDGEERVKAQRLRTPGFDKLRVEPAEEGKPGDVEIVVSASHVGVAHFCWQLEALAANTAAAAATTPPAAVPVQAAAAKAPEATEKATEQGTEQPKLQTATTPETSAARRPKLAPKNQRLRQLEGAKLRPTVPLKQLKKTPEASKER